MRKTTHALVGGALVLPLVLLALVAPAVNARNYEVCPEHLSGCSGHKDFEPVCCVDDTYCAKLHKDRPRCSGSDSLTSSIPTSRRPPTSNSQVLVNPIRPDSPPSSSYDNLSDRTDTGASSESDSPHFPTTRRPSRTSAFDQSARPSVTSKLSELRLSSDWNVNAPPQTREYWWEIDERWGSPDGFHRPMLVVNGQYPGPLVEVNNGDLLVVHVVNSLDQPITIHWHGLVQNGTNWEDGPSGVTQCPIPPRGSYTYRFPVTGDLQYGTYWWHAHRRALYADGVIGPLIVHSPEDPLVRGRDYDIDQIVTLVDWYHDTSDDIVNQLLSPEGYQNTFIAPSPNSVLLNGQGTYDCSFAAQRDRCDQKELADLPELRLPADSRIRLRFIHMGAHPVFLVSVDEHELEIIEADDTPVYGPNVHRIPIVRPSQSAYRKRYSAILDTTFHRTGDSFLLRAQVNTDCLGAPFPDLDTQARMVIRIGEDSDRLGNEVPQLSRDWNDPTTVNCTDLDEDLLSPRIVRNPPRFADQISFFNSSRIGSTNVTGDADDILLWTLNNITFENFAYNPILHQVMRGDRLDVGRVAIIGAGLETVDLVIQNIVGPDHPFHLHGQPMWIMARGRGTLSRRAAASLRLDTTNPLRRDTLNVAPGEWVLVRTVTDVPGVFAFHCHIVWHQAQGLLGALIAQPDVIRTFDIPRDNLALCDSGNANMIDPGRRFRRSVSQAQVLSSHQVGGAEAAPMILKSRRYAM
ncbi:hypothetical protein Rhopal_004325-T1 [Rhodotorula paludigena]|uniref:Laccase n=1 Tax=Rhodotorula paludigena TaxID=86838 RepID=A0AAV5GFH6_9BASI|nr:hypothetical protein Rhopal_004325-T1 [Rhodotorula paludigena]